MSEREREIVSAIDCAGINRYKVVMFWDEMRGQLVRENNVSVCV